MIRKSLVYIILLVLCAQTHSIKIDRAIVSTNTNPTYIDFWPVVAKAWTKMGIKPTLALIADDDVEIDESLGDVIRFKPIPGVPTSIQAQTIRLLLPAYFEDEVSIISDIDMLPLNKAYYVDGVKSCPDNAFVVYRPNPYPDQKLISMCYNAAKGSTFKEVFHIKSIEDIPAIIKAWSKKLKNNPMTDEIILYNYIHAWKDYKTRCVKLKDVLGGRRIDRSCWRYDVALLKQNYYVDSHMVRPYKKYKAEIDELATHIGLGDVGYKKYTTFIIIALLALFATLYMVRKRKK